MSTDGLPFDDAMKRALDDDSVPPMSPDFADRVVAATKGRAAPLPRVRLRPMAAPARRWRTGRRLVIGAAIAGALATTAAATGVLEDLGIRLPSPQQVWTAVTGGEPEPSPTPELAPASRFVPVPEGRAPVTIEGPIDTPEELEEAFRRVDEVRDNRREGRRERIDGRIDDAIERRREQGLSITPEQEERLRGRVQNFRERADQRREERTGQRREELRQTLEEEGEVSREDIIRDPDSPAGRRLQRFRQLPPEERRERLRQWRERRQDRLRQEPDGPPEESPEPPDEEGRDQKNS